MRETISASIASLKNLRSIFIWFFTSIFFISLGLNDTPAGTYISLFFLLLLCIFDAKTHQLGLITSLTKPEKQLLLALIVWIFTLGISLAWAPNIQESFRSFSKDLIYPLLVCIALLYLIKYRQLPAQSVIFLTMTATLIAVADYSLMTTSLFPDLIAQLRKYYLQENDFGNIIFLSCAAAVYPCMSKNIYKVTTGVIFSIIAIYTLFTTLNDAAKLILLLILALSIIYYGLSRFAKAGFTVTISLVILAATLLAFIPSSHKDSINRKLSSDPRPSMWNFYFSQAKSYWLTGCGYQYHVLKNCESEHPSISNKKIEYSKNHPESKNTLLDYEHAHNMFINAHARAGIPGLLGMLFLWFTLFKIAIAIFRNPISRDEGFVMLLLCGAFFLKNMTDDFFTRNNTVIFLVNYLALLMIAQDRQVSGKGGKPKTTLTNDVQPHKLD